MKIRKWTDSKKIYRVKNIKKYNGGKNMENVISLETYSNKKYEQSYCIFDMILDKEKREEVYKYYDDNYKETDEEKEIFDSWKKRRTRRNK